MDKKSDQNYRIAQLEPPFGTEIVHLKRLRPISARYEHLSAYDPAGFQNQHLQESSSKPPNPSKTLLVQDKSLLPPRTRSGRHIKVPNRFQNSGGS